MNRGKGSWGRMRFNVTTFGAAADGSALATFALQSAIDACAAAGGGTVTFPPGRYLSGSLWLKSNVTLHLEAGAVLQGSGREEDFPEWASRWEGPNAVTARSPLIAGEDLENIAITGRGIIDGGGKPWWHRHWDHGGDSYKRPLLVRVVNCHNVLIEGLTFRNSPMWTLSPLACDNVNIRGVTILNPPHSPNTDGINPDSCSNVRISDCHVDVGDDCITIKSGKEDDGRQTLRACENLTITNCTLIHGHGGVVIGSEVSGSVRNVTISNCVFVGTDRGIRLKARRGRGGVVENIRASNLVMDGVLCPIVVNLFYGCGAWNEKKVTDTSPQPVNDGTPRFRRLRFSGITARNVKYAAVYILGLPEMFVEDVALRDVSIYLDPECADGGPPDMSPSIPVHVRGGVIADHVRNLSLQEIDIANQQGSSLMVRDVHTLAVTGLRSHSVAVDDPMIRLLNVRDAVLSNCMIPSSAMVGIDIRGHASRGIRLDERDFLPAQQPIEVADNVPADAVDSGREGIAK